MMTNEVATVGPDLIERVVAGGDLAQLSPAQRTAYYQAVCDSLGLNPLTRPFEYIRLQGKLTLYVRRDATDQLRKINGISVEIKSRSQLGDLYVVTASARDRDGRVDESIGAVSVQGLSGEALANALMKAETKAKRRVTLSICGLGLTDETEVDSIPSARPVVVLEDGVIDAEPEPAPGPVSALVMPVAQPHWAESPDGIKRFWAWTGSLGLSNAQVHEALGVEHLKEYVGDKRAAMAAINAYIEAHAAPAEQEVV